jgi:cation diffusion facilitator CzcD-associated flavoprotein CzcO
VPDTTTVIIGAGHCGLAMSHCLAARSVDHVVLERGEVANSWRTQRWDSLRGVTACPGLHLIGMPFLRRRKSSLIDGAADDAVELTGHLAGYLDALAGRRERSAS